MEVDINPVSKRGSGNDVLIGGLPLRSFYLSPEIETYECSIEFWPRPNNF